MYLFALFRLSIFFQKKKQKKTQSFASSNFAAMGAAYTDSNDVRWSQAWSVPFNVGGSYQELGDSCNVRKDFSSLFFFLLMSCLFFVFH